MVITAVVGALVMGAYSASTDQIGDTLVTKSLRLLGVEADSGAGDSNSAAESAEAWKETVERRREAGEAQRARAPDRQELGEEQRQKAIERGWDPEAAKARRENQPADVKPDE
jgi:hypothetical protein